MPTNQLTSVDFELIAANVVDRSTDVLTIFLFDSGTSIPLGKSELLDFLGDRASKIPELRWTVTTVPGGLNFPHWVDSEPFDIADHVDDSTEITSWEGIFEYFSEIAAQIVDPYECLWRLHVVRGIRDAPGMQGEATAVILKASHALGDGRTYNAIVQALFSSTPLPEFVPELTAPNPWWLAVKGLLGTPRQYVRAIRALPETRKHDAPNSGGGTVTFSGKRSAAAITLDLRQIRDFKGFWPGVTVTSVAQTIISFSLEERFGDKSPRSMQVMSGAPADADVRGQNHMGCYHIDLAMDKEDPADRIVAITENNVKGKAGFPDAFRAVRALQYELPAIAVKPKLSAEPKLGTVASSVNRGPATMTLGDSRIVLTASFPYVSPRSPFNHGIYSVGDVLTISVMSGTPDAGDIREYAAILEKNAARVMACLEKQKTR
ncbi:wax ester/triacylglycerol synthase domain-containing protein [Rhodococcus sp. IEGM 1379]|uniref:wax ester/triacylglycerol synthase domain-containing protein n=1 Tax=Rhodococcus sp. IEGM 1379 TaxID=3047086 RepID=UPI0024B74999|nr:wax ester/triacylglycerol synthase domain-containing protein [Rhodococcus sp. IEGM 1379]MDI9918872.1 wax ester/triacylglycerol synthase family O-acyltransferase [Rhodococcus sp. IEGM 1379]